MLQFQIKMKVGWIPFRALPLICSHLADANFGEKRHSFANKNGAKTKKI